MWWLGLIVAVGYTAFGVIMIRRREAFARRGARFHQRVARVAPWLYSGGIGRAYVGEDLWRKLIVPIAIAMIVGGIALGVLIWMTT